MEQVRRNLFETNSSSTHSLTMCTKTDYDEWKAGKLIYDKYNSCLIPLDDPDYQKELKENPDDVSDYYFTYDEFWSYAEDYEGSFKDEFNDVIAFGYYGYD